MGKGEMNKNEGNKRASGVQKQQPKRSRTEKEDDVPSGSNITARRQPPIRGSETRRPSSAGQIVQGPQQVY